MLVLASEDINKLFSCLLDLIIVFLVGLVTLQEALLRLVLILVDLCILQAEELSLDPLHCGRV